MKHTGIPVKGVRVKDGKLVRVHKMDASARIRRAKSKKVKVGRRGTV